MSFLIFATDKFQAKNNRMRIPENTLLVVTFLGGSIGSILAMLLFRHKTSKRSFLLKFFLVAAVQIILIILFIRKSQILMANTNQSLFESFANKATAFTGSSPAFIGAVLIVIIWAISGPFFKFSETWQLVINTGTTIITFLMVFLIQKAQNKDSKAIQIKLNELIASNENASNRIVDIEDLTEKELDQLHRYYEMLSDYAEKEEDIHQSHSIDAARKNQDNKYEAFQKRHEEWVLKQNQKKES